MSTLGALVIIVACIATFIVMGITPGQAHPQSLDSTDVHRQCRRRGYEGACLVKVNKRGFPMGRCRQLVCGKMIGTYMVAHDTKRALDGTFCGPSHICKAGKCMRPSRVVSPGGVGATLKCISPLRIPPSPNNFK